jgi:hypothetical protein
MIRSRSFLSAALRFVLAASPLLCARAAESSPATRTVAAAEALISTLDAAQRSAVVFAYTNQVQRRLWSNLPTPMVRRTGLRWGDLKPDQLKAAEGVLKAALSGMGYEKVMNIVEAEEVLKNSPGNPGNLVFGKDEFYLSFVGAPSAEKPWMIQFGGHHLAINVTVAGTNGVLTPSLTCTQPASFQRDGKTVRPLGRENDLAFQLMGTLDASQKSAAVLGARFRDIVLGPGQDGRRIAPEGVKVSTFTPDQRKLLLELVSQWVGIIRDDAAAAKMSEIEGNLDQTWFAWSGPTEPGSAAYFRIQGPTVVIEYAPQSLGGSALNHTHTIYRDPTNDYGSRFGGF